MSEQIENRVLDSETRKLLAKAGALGFTENLEFNYVPKAFREKDKESGEYKIPKKFWPVFALVGKDGIEASKMEDNMGHMEYDDKSDIRRWVGKSGTHRIKVLREGLKGWKNFFDSEGEEIQYRQNQNNIHEASLKRIPATLGIELCNAIIDRITLTAEELEGLSS